MIEPRQAGVMGQGIFATETIAAGQEICRNQARPFSHEEWEAVKASPFGHLVFMNKEDYAKGICSGFLALGLSSIVNHGEPNASVDPTEERGRLEAVLVSLREIQKGEQILISYTNLGDYGFAD